MLATVPVDGDHGYAEQGLAYVGVADERHHLAHGLTERPAAVEVRQSAERQHQYAEQAVHYTQAVTEGETNAQ